MKQSQFFGWIKKAYPGINYVEKDDGNIWFSSGRFLEVIASEDYPTRITFKTKTPAETTTDDIDIVSMIRKIWGEPAVAFSYNGKEPKKPEEPPQPTPPPAEPKKKPSGSDRERALERIKSELGDSIEITNIPGGKAVKTSAGRLVLYDLGISSRPSEFVPWPRVDEVEKIINTFILTNKN